MRKIFIILHCLTFLVIFSALKSYSQYIIAGQHDSGCYFYDINPDTTITGP